MRCCAASIWRLLWGSCWVHSHHEAPLIPMAKVTLPLGAHHPLDCDILAQQEYILLCYHLGFRQFSASFYMIVGQS
eukprot:COSAG06_NODE_4675_length_4043_cov_37.866886_5_plen_76_part_00